MASADPWAWAHEAREAAIQMLYQWEIGRLTVPEVADSFWRIGEVDPPLSDRIRERASALVAGTVAALATIDPIIEDASKHWRLERMPVLDRLVLRLALYELLREPSTPGAVVIDEALELTRRFSTEEAVPFVNGVLDAVKRRIERGELAVGPTTTP
jgi:N utilization substance protein B